MTLEEQLAADFPRLVRLLGAECTIWTTRGTFALFKPKECLHLSADGKYLALGHPMGACLFFEPKEILHVSGGVVD